MRALRAFALAAATAFLVAGCSLPGAVGGDREISAVFDDVGDLVLNHSIQMADVRIGSVTGIELTEDFRARVTFSIKDGLDVPKDSRAVLRTTSLLGEKFIELRPNGDPTAGPFLEDGDEIAVTEEAPELEFVAEEAVELLGGVVANDLSVLIETGAVAFGDRENELRAIIEDLSVISGTLADQTDEIVRIIDALDGASATLAGGATSLDQLLVNLADATTVLSDNRQLAIDAIEELTYLAQAQNEVVLEPYLSQVDTQIKQLDAIVAEIARNRDIVGNALFWIGEFSEGVPLAIPGDFAQVYALFEAAEEGG